MVPHSSSSLSVAQKEPALFLLSPGGELLSPHEECQVRKLWLHSHHLQQDKALSVLTEKKKKNHHLLPSLAEIHNTLLLFLPIF